MSVAGRGSPARAARAVLAACALLVPASLAACSGTPAHQPHPAAAATSSSGQTGAMPSSAGLSSSAAGASATPSGTGPAHVVVAVFENKSYAQVTSPATAPWLTSLMASSAVFTNMHAETHPSQPNYLALFSGSTQAVTDDHCPVDLGNVPNLGQQLQSAGYTFAGYSEDLPKVGYLGCSSGLYAAKHNPWADFGNVPYSANRPYTAFPADYANLPTVSFVIPNLCHDMHNCSVSVGDNWARANLAGYVQWARQHNSVLILTFDEDDNSPANHILTLIAGAGVRPGQYTQSVNHYNLLRTVEEWYGLAPLQRAADVTPISGVWSPTS